MAANSIWFAAESARFAAESAENEIIENKLREILDKGERA